MSTAEQVADEILDYFQNVELLGRFAGEPVRQQKKTFLVLSLRNFIRDQTAPQSPQVGIDNER